MANDAAGYVRKGGIGVPEFADRFQNAAVAYGLVDAHGQDAIQTILADALKEPTALNGNACRIGPSARAVERTATREWQRSSVRPGFALRSRDYARKNRVALARPARAREAHLHCRRTWHGQKPTDDCRSRGGDDRRRVAVRRGPGTARKCHYPECGGRRGRHYHSAPAGGWRRSKPGACGIGRSQRRRQPAGPQPTARS